MLFRVYIILIVLLFTSLYISNSYALSLSKGAASGAASGSASGGAFAGAAGGALVGGFASAVGQAALNAAATASADALQAKADAAQSALNKFVCPVGSGGGAECPQNGSTYAAMESYLRGQGCGEGCINSTYVWIACHPGAGYPSAAQLLTVTAPPAPPADCPEKQALRDSANAWASAASAARKIANALGATNAASPDLAKAGGSGAGDKGFEGSDGKPQNPANPNPDNPSDPSNPNPNNSSDPATNPQSGTDPNSSASAKKSKPSDCVANDPRPACWDYAKKASTETSTSTSSCPLCCDAVDPAFGGTSEQVDNLRRELAGDRARAVNASNQMSKFFNNQRVGFDNGVIDGDYRAKKFLCGDDFCGYSYCSKVSNSESLDCTLYAPSLFKEISDYGTFNKSGGVCSAVLLDTGILGMQSVDAHCQILGSIKSKIQLALTFLILFSSVKIILSA